MSLLQGVARWSGSVVAAGVFLVSFVGFFLLSVVSGVIAERAVEDGRRRLEDLVTALVPKLKFDLLFSLVASFAISRSVANGFYNLSELLTLTALVAAARFDHRLMASPRVLSVGVLPIVVALSGRGNFFSRLLGPASSVAAALSLAGLFWFASFLRYMFKRSSGAGSGDFEFLLLIGATLGLVSGLSVLVLASVAGALYGLAVAKSESGIDKVRLPFIPFMLLGYSFVLAFRGWSINAVIV